MEKSVIEKLEAPFAPEQVKSRQGNFGQVLSYLEGWSIIERLNQVFQNEWSFEITWHQILDDEVIVQGKHTAGTVVKEAFGGSKITRNKDDGKAISISDDLKASETDCIKKCSTLLGVGLYLYRSDQPETTNRSKNPPAKSQGNGGNGGQSKGNGSAGNRGNGDNGNNGNGHVRLTNKQLQAIYSIGKDKGMNGKAIKDYCREVFNKMPDYLSKQEASTIIQELMGKQ